MQCKTCKCEMEIIRHRIEAQGDNSPDTKTEVFEVLEMACRSKQCPEYGKVQAEKRVQLM